jgi:hypothetical protein
VVLAAERRDLAPVPVGLINGTTYRDGTQPPFRPLAAIEAIRYVIRHPRAAAQDIISMIGPTLGPPCTQAYCRCSFCVGPRP